jgi:CheY-like chemotaxis protein
VSSNDNYRQISTVRVLVVEDFEPLREFVCSLLLKSVPRLQIVGEVSDGLAAVHRAKELQRSDPS